MLWWLLTGGFTCVHGYMGAVMGKVSECDDAAGPGIDWSDRDFKQFTCMEQGEWKAPMHGFTRYYQIPHFNATTDVVGHRCMQETIAYDSSPPLRGDHRPNWAVFGEYLYLPEQRWLHNLEHGSIVLLYHPCADSSLIAAMRTLITSCLYRHVITPYEKLKKKNPIALVAWGAKLEMSAFDEKSAIDFIRKHARIAPENMSKQGKYSTYLIKQSQPPEGSNIDDDYLCPKH